MICDLVVVAVGWVVGSLAAAPARGASPGMLALELLLVLPAAGLMLSANGLYRRRICQVRAIEVSRIMRTATMLCVLLLLVHLATLTVAPGETLLAVALAGVVWFTLLTIERGLLREWIAGRRAGGAYGAPVLVVGGEPASTARVAAFLADNPILGLDVRGLLCPRPAGDVASDIGWLGDVDELRAVARSTKVSGAVLDASSLNGQLNGAVRSLGEANLHVHVYSGLRGIERRRIQLSPMVDETFLHIRPIGLGPRQRATKRALDLAVASLLLLITAPVLLLAAISLRVVDRGPVLYRQTRVGHEGEVFTVLKLRTMCEGAHQERKQLQTGNLRDGPLFKLDHDPRVTPIGRFLRMTSLDELPQLLNVLEGTMSMVGPRPALPEEVEQFDDELAARMSVKPGLTGLWQVEARDLPSFDLYRRFDLLYAQNWSLGLDLAVLVRTSAVVVVRMLRALIPGRLRRASVRPMA